MWLRASHLITKAKHVSPKIRHARPTQPLACFSCGPQRFLQTNRLFALAKELRSEHDDPIFAVASPSATAEAYARNVLTADRTDWLSILEASDVPSIIERARQVGTSGPHGSNRHLGSTAKFPPWFPLYLLYQKASAPRDILVSVELVYQQLSIVDPPISDGLIILAVARLAERKFTATLRGLVWKFCDSSPLPSERHCNLLLRALSLHPRSEETSILARKVLTEMSRHQRKTSDEAYNALLHHHFVTLTLAAAVEKKMAQEKVRPTAAQLVSLLRLMVAHRFSGRAAAYLDALQRLQHQSNSSLVSYGSKPTLMNNVKATIQNTRFLKSFRRPSAAFRYLDSMSVAQMRAPIRKFMFRRGQPRNLRRVWRRKHLHINVRDWVAALYVASRSKEVAAMALLTAFRQGAGAYAPSRIAYSTVIRGLLYKRDHSNAAALWDESCSLDLPLDTISVGIGAHALVMNGEAHRAFQLLEQVHSSYQSWKAEYSGRGRRNAPSPNHRPPAEVNLHAVHQVMVALRRMGRPDVVFALWDDLETLYGLSPDVYSLNILLQTARWGKKYDDTIRGQLSYFGFGPSTALSQSSSADTPLDLRTEAASRISAMLDPRQRPWVTGRWKSEPAAQVALQIVVQMFLGNWPELRDVSSPVQALRRSSRDVGLSPVSEAINAVTGRRPYEESPLLLMFSAESPVRFPQIVPTDVTLRAIIDLLAAESLHSEIPLVAAWMRALDIRPSKLTIATALIHWIDVSMHSPFIERVKGRYRKDPFALLNQWFDDWVGTKNMPSREEISAEMRRSAYYKDVQYLDVINDRINRRVQRSHRPT